MNLIYYKEITEAFPEESTNDYNQDPSKLNDELADIKITGSCDLPSWFGVTDLAVETISTAGIMLARLCGDVSLAQINIDRRLASLWFKRTLQPIEWSLPPVWDAITGNYQTIDGWIRLHTNVPKHRMAALSTIGLNDLRTEINRGTIEKIILQWHSKPLVESVIEAGGCAAIMYSPKEWLEHPQGIAVSKEPLIIWDEQICVKPFHPTAINLNRPLEGIRVLDLTRILAGPIATRFLAAYGADILRIDPPGWDEPSNAPEVTLGKRCAGLDLSLNEDRKQFEDLLKDADILVHGYRSGALDKLGYDRKNLSKLNPGLIDITLNAYGWSGPWTQRRGFDSIVQMSCGIAAHGQEKEHSDCPVLLPAQALDHGTGYLMAAAALHALFKRQTQGVVYSARLSLARTAHLLMTQQQKSGRQSIIISEDDVSDTIEPTDWGNAKRIHFPLRIEGINAVWKHPATYLRSAIPKWMKTNLEFRSRLINESLRSGFTK